MTTVPLSPLDAALLRAKEEIFLPSLSSEGFMHNRRGSVGVYADYHLEPCGAFIGMNIRHALEKQSLQVSYVPLNYLTCRVGLDARDRELESLASVVRSLANGLPANVALIDVGYPEAGKRRVIERLKTAVPTRPVVVMTCTPRSDVLFGELSTIATDAKANALISLADDLQNPMKIVADAVNTYFQKTE